MTEKKVLTDAEIVDLIAKYNDPIASPALKSSIVTTIVMHNEKLITHLIKKNYPSYMAAHMDDLLQEGRVAIIENFMYFDSDRGKFSTFISVYITHALHKYICSLHSTSVHYSQSKKKVDAAMLTLAAKGIKRPSAADIANEIGIGQNAVQAALRMRSRSNCISLDGDDMKNIFDPLQFNTEEIVENTERYQALYTAIESLPYLERVIISSQYFSASTNNPLSLKKVSELLVRQHLIEKENALELVRKKRTAALNHLRKNALLSSMITDFNREVEDVLDTINISFVVSDAALRENLSYADQIDLDF